MREMERLYDGRFPKLGTDREGSSILSSRFLREIMHQTCAPNNTVLAVLVLKNKGAAGHANASNNAFASSKSAVSKPSVNHP
jgi:hypothetical protein